MSETEFNKAIGDTSLLLGKKFLRGEIESCSHDMLSRAADEIENLEYQLAEANAEIEAMRPFLKMAKRHRSIVSSACACDVCLVLCEYEARKQP